MHFFNSIMVVAILLYTGKTISDEREENARTYSYLSKLRTSPIEFTTCIKAIT